MLRKYAISPSPSNSCSGRRTRQTERGLLNNRRAHGMSRKLPRLRCHNSWRWISSVRGKVWRSAEGVRKARISPQAVRKLVQRLRREDFFHWEEKKVVCVDYPEVHITVDLNAQHKRVIEGCNTPGKVLKLADEIDRVSGAKRWVGKVR